jgi:hypothetical protein
MSPSQIIFIIKLSVVLLSFVILFPTYVFRHKIFTFVLSVVFFCSVTLFITYLLPIFQAVRCIVFISGSRLRIVIVIFFFFLVCWAKRKKPDSG